MAVLARRMSTQILTLVGSEGLVTTISGLSYCVSSPSTFSIMSCASNEFNSSSTFSVGGRERACMVEYMASQTD